MSFGIQDDGKYFVARDGTTYGPYRGDALPAMFAAKQVLPTDLISEQGKAEWITVAQAISIHNPGLAPLPPTAMSTAGGSTNGLGIASFVIGCASLLLSLACTGGAFPAVLGLVLGIVALKHPDRGLAIAGIILNAVTILLAVLSLLGAALCCMSAAAL